MNIKKVLSGWSVGVVIVFLFASCAVKEQRHVTPVRSPDELTAKQLKMRITNAGGITQLRAGGESIYKNAAITGFYSRRLYKPAWTNEQGPTRLLGDMVRALKRAKIEGLPPKDYHLGSIETILAELRADIQKGLMMDPVRRADLDLLLTDSFLAYVSPLLPGRVKPETLQSQRAANERNVALAAVLESALASGNISDALGTPAPDQLGLRRLREALVRYRELASKGGWPAIPEGPTLKRGDKGSRVALLRERLTIEGDLAAARAANPDLFDETIENALKRFQRRHILSPDGIMDAGTRAELNINVERRIEQLELNLERWRWLPQDLGRRYILINIPAFKLEVRENESLALDMRVVVGKSETTTPVLNATLDYMFFNPYWNVPRDMAAYEMLPRIKRDQSYLARQNLRMYDGMGPDAREVDPKTVDWSSITADKFPFRLRQDPGPWNGMGRVKFIFINRFDVYLHDTPGRHLFEKTSRAFSHGCIRAEKPIELAMYLLKQDPQWNRDEFLRDFGKKKNYTVMVPEKIPIYLVYFTAWATGNGTIQFCPDIYGWDEPFLSNTSKRLPTKEAVGTQNSSAQGG